MTYEFKCEAGHVTELKFSTIGKAIAHFESPDNSDTYGSIECVECCPNGQGCCEDAKAQRVYGNSGTVFYGQGWDKPAPSGKTATRGVDPTKAIPSLGPPRDKGFMGRPGVR